MEREGSDDGNVKRFEEVLEEFYRENGIGFGGGDIFCTGPGPVDERLKLLIQPLVCFHDEKGHSPFAQILVVVPPTIGIGRSLRSLEAKLNAWSVSKRLRSPEAEKSGDWFRFVEVADLRSALVVAAVQGLPRQSVIIVSEAASFRDEELPARIDIDRTNLREDFWAPQVHALCLRLLSATAGQDSYILLDTGEVTPRRPENVKLLKSIGRVGVMGGEIRGNSESILGDHLAKWEQLLSEGRVGSVLQEIESLPLSSEEKSFFRIQMLSRAEFHGQALEEIERFPIVSDVAPVVLCKLARIASDGGATFLAARFLKSAVEELDTVESLALAVDTAWDISEDGLEAKAAARLAKLFPGHPVLKRRQLRQLAATGDYRALAVSTDHSAERRSLFAAMTESVPDTGTPDYAGIRSKLQAEFPSLRGLIQSVLIQDARRRQLPIHALALAISASVDDSGAARVILDLVGDLLLDRDEKGGLRADLDQLSAATAKVVGYLAQNPADSNTRTRLFHALSLDVAGTLGVPLLATVALNHLRRPLDLVKAKHHDGFSPDEFLDKLDFITSVFSWLGRESPSALGKIVLPRELLTEPADKVAPAILRILELHTSRLNDEDDIRMLASWLSFGLSINPHTQTRDHDLPMIRTAAVIFATAGRVQLARDMAEQLLRLGADTPQRRRIAWFAVADIYHRLGNKLESLIAFACAAAGDTRVDGEEAWNEVNGLVRILRDIGLFQVAREIHKKGGEILPRLGLAEENAHRQRFMSLTIDMLEARYSSAEFRSQIPALLERVTTSAEEELAKGDNPEPVIIALAQMMQWAIFAGLKIPQKSHEIFDILLEQVSAPAAKLARTLSSQQPDAQGILDIHGNVENARYADDVAYDVRFSAMASHRLLSSESAKNNPVSSTFAIEMLADRAIPAPGWEVTSKPLPAIVSVSEPGDVATSMTREGMSVVLLGIDADGHLRRVDWIDGKGGVVSEAPDAFSVTEFRKWTDEFPFRYGIDEDTPNLFFLSTDRIRLSSSLPDGPVVVIADTELQQLPCNIMRVGDRFAGQERPMAAAPSLSWLKAARAHPAKTDGRMVAWISKEEKLGQTFVTITGRLLDTLQKHGIELDDGPNIPEGLAGSELVIVTAHGGLGLDLRYFQRVSDEGSLVRTSRELAASLRNVGVVILFVCSGGRADKVPDAITTVGLAKKLLEEGCSAVIASPWPLDSRVTYHWLPAFLDAWTKGSTLAQANFQANQAVAKGLGAEPAKCLAMTIFGDPLRQWAKSPKV
ncbi:CHAT domain-containing protein [Mesorhizobium sp.]|uniref:CHAT domain-containing protein n=1 Tax=Mesorhizobium sp. TaxID=1871066 RepID=UPI0025C05FFA|nr:CHAT domain-containing protein [Mesorhizobium sp.]